MRSVLIRKIPPRVVWNRQAVSRFTRGDVAWRPRIANGGVCLPGSGLGSRRFDVPRNFDVCRAAIQRGAIESIAEDTRRGSRGIRANGGPCQLSRIAVDAGGAIKRLLDFLGRVAGKCELCQAFDKLLTCLLLGRLRRPRPMREFRLTLSFG